MEFTSSATCSYPALGLRQPQIDPRGFSMTEPEISEDLIAAHGLKPDEYSKILEILGRSPTFTELGIFSAMWNEHCSYKSSRVHLKSPKKVLSVYIKLKHRGRIAPGKGHYI